MTALDDNREIATENWYRDYYNKKGVYRNSLFHNPEVLFQTLAHDASFIRAIGCTDIDSPNAKVLDAKLKPFEKLMKKKNITLTPKEYMELRGAVEYLTIRKKK